MAIDAVAAQLMGYDPLTIPYLRMAHDRGLGVADPREIALLGDDASDVNVRCRPSPFSQYAMKLVGSAAPPAVNART